MKKLIMTAAAATLTLTAAHAKDAYPISGAFSTSLTTNQAELRPIKYADPGFFQGTFAASVFYAPIDPLLLSASLSAFKSFDAGQGGQGTIGATVPGHTQLQDVGLSIDWNIGTLGPAIFSTGVGFTVPLSENSRAAGNLTSISPSVSVQFNLPAKFAIQLAGGITYNVNEDPTQRIDCSDARFRDVCEVSGADLGNPNSLLTYGGSLGIVSRPIKGLVVTAGYSIGAGIGEVDFPNDEFTPTGVEAQDGTQYTAASHGTRFGISYSLAGLSSSADTAENLNPNIDPSLQVAGDDDSPFWTRFTLNLSMSTRDLVYARDRSDGVRVTVPVYDFETQTGERTTYTLGISYNI